MSLTPHPFPFSTLISLPQNYFKIIKSDLGQAELVVIDEAAAIPLPLVKSLLGPYLVFMASTINGYEGTGRSLSLKLIQQLRQSQSLAPSTSTSASGTATGATSSTLGQLICICLQRHDFNELSI